jgi:hypothetical protein
MPALLAVVLATAPLTISLDSPQKQLYVGEPWKIVVTLTAGRTPINVVPETDRFELGTLRFHVDDGSGERPYTAPHAGWGPDVVVSTPLRAGERLVRNYVLEGGLFPRAGRYALRAEQRSWGVGRQSGNPVASKRMVVEVVDPPEDERVVASWLTGSARNARVAAVGYGDPEVAALDRLLADHPRSRCLLAPRLRRLKVLTGRAPYDVLDRERMWALRQSDPKEHLRQIREHYAGLVRQVLGFEGWGVYEEDALMLALQLAGQAGDAAEQARIRADLRDRFPRSAAANRLEHERLAAR